MQLWTCWATWGGVTAGRVRERCLLVQLDAKKACSHAKTTFSSWWEVSSWVRRLRTLESRSGSRRSRDAVGGAFHHWREIWACASLFWKRCRVQQARRRQAQLRTCFTTWGGVTGGRVRERCLVAQLDARTARSCAKMALSTWREVYLWSRRVRTLQRRSDSRRRRDVAGGAFEFWASASLLQNKCWLQQARRRRAQLLTCFQLWREIWACASLFWKRCRLQHARRRETQLRTCFTAWGGGTADRVRMRLLSVRLAARNVCSRAKLALSRWRDACFTSRRVRALGRRGVSSRARIALSRWRDACLCSRRVRALERRAVARCSREVARGVLRVWRAARLEGRAESDAQAAFARR